MREDEKVEKALCREGRALGDHPEALGLRGVRERHLEHLQHGGRGGVQGVRMMGGDGWLRS